MPYCLQYLRVNDAETLECTVKMLAKEQFHARDAYPMDNPCQYNIDDSLNDIRALTDVTNNTIRLFCRYKYDVKRMSQRVIKFANNHSDLCVAIDETSGGN